MTMVYLDMYLRFLVSERGRRIQISTGTGSIWKANALCRLSSSVLALNQGLVCDLCCRSGQPVFSYRVRPLT